MSFVPRVLVAARASSATQSAVCVRGFATGTTKWFNVKKGFGFITPDESGASDGERSRRGPEGRGGAAQRGGARTGAVPIFSRPPRATHPSQLSPARRLIACAFPLPRLSRAVFVHQSSVQGTGFRFLKEGEKVSARRAQRRANHRRSGRTTTTRSRHCPLR